MYSVARNMGSLWNTYDFQKDTLKGLKIGGGITLRDSSTNYPNTYNVPGFATVDLLTSYNLKVKKIGLANDAANPYLCLFVSF